MTTSESTAQLNAAMALAQGKMKPALKDAKNPHFGSKYADLASIIDACREPLASNGIAVYQTLGTPVAGNLAVTTRLGHKSGEFLQETVHFPVGQNTAQAYGSAATYARRYALSAMLCIAADDDDGEAAVAKPPEPPTPIRRPRPAGAMTPAAAIEIPRTAEQDSKLRFELAASVVNQHSPANYRSIMDTYGLPLDLSFDWTDGQRPPKLGLAYKALRAEADRIADSSKDPA